MPVFGQISTPCTPSMLTTFSPCMNFITNSSTNGTAPSADCCNSLRSVMSNGTDCLCLIATGSVPFQVPINRTLAISLPRACNMPGVPLQCKGKNFKFLFYLVLHKIFCFYSYGPNKNKLCGPLIVKFLNPSLHVFLYEVGLRIENYVPPLRL